MSGFASGGAADVAGGGIPGGGAVAGGAAAGAADGAASSAPYSVREVLAFARELWPEASAESWDTVGLMAGSPASAVSRVLFAVDPTLAVLEEAREWGAELVITHHPLLLRGITTASEETLKGALLARLYRSGIALYAAHTNADQPEGGVSAVLGARLGLREARAIVPAPHPRGESETFGIGRVGELAEQITLREFAERVREVLPATVSGVRVAGDEARLVRRVALLGGAGDSLLEHPEVLASDVYLTSDLRHHPALDAHERARLGKGPALVDVAHAAAEWLWLPAVAERFEQRFAGLRTRVSSEISEPWSFAL